jgi:hypothetical protein
MDNESVVETEIKKKNSSGPDKKMSKDISEVKHRYIYSRKDEKDSIANLIDELLYKCNQKDYGAAIDFSMLVGHSLKKLNDADIAEIQNNSLSDEDRAHEEVKKFNIKHGTNYTMFEFVLNGLPKKSKKGVNQ